MKKIILFVTIYFFSINVFAQLSENIKVPRVDLQNFISKEKYKYANFAKGKVYFKDLDSAGGKLNYNYLLQTIQFIDNKGDTLKIINENDILFISIESDSFFHQKVFYEWIATEGDSRLVKKNDLKIFGDPKMVGAYGIPSATSQIQSHSNIETINLGVNEQYEFLKEKKYYISIHKKNFVEFNKSNLKKLFPKKSNEIEKYINERKINFSEEPSLIFLFSFISSL
jgi:hypothetical protein